MGIPEIIAIAFNLILSALNFILFFVDKKRGKLNLFAAVFCALVAIAIAVVNYDCK